MGLESNPGRRCGRVVGDSSMLALGIDPGSYASIFVPTNRPTVLALLATTYEQVVVSPETTMGCHKIRFLQEKEGY